MPKVTLKINGQEVEVEKGTTILQAAKQAGIYIPTLCYHPYLPLEEACRICVVEDVRGGWSTLVAACVFPVRNGMVIETDSEKVMESRRTIMELLLSDHPNDCMTCYATGECELQDMAHLYNVKMPRYEGERHKYDVDPDPNPQLHLNMNKCILCRRCIRACHDIQGADIWTKVGRGFDQRIATAFDLPLLEAGCELCGHCVDFCPVDAIGWRGGRGVVRSWQMNGGSTICLLCPSGCRAEYDSYEGKIVRVRGDFESPANLGALCKMGRFNFDFVNSPDRVKSAFIRDEKGALKEATIDEAIKAAADSLAKLKEASDGSGIGVVCGGMLTNEEYYMAQKLARAALQTNNIDNVAGPWQQTVYDALSSCTGIGGMTNTLGEIAHAGAVLALGSNTLEKHAIAGIRARKAAREGAPLIVAHPEQVPLTKTASMHLQLNEGSEDALVVGLIKTILEEGLYDKAYIEEHTQDFEKLERNVEKINMSELVEKTGLSEDQIREAARQYAGKRPACLIYGIDPATSPLNETFYRMCAALQMLLGSLGVVGGGVNVMGCAGNAQGAVDFGAVPKYLPGYRPATQSASRKAVAKVWGVEPAEKLGMSWPDIFKAIEEGQVKGLYLIGVDPFSLGMPTSKVEGALARLQTLIVEDCVKTRAFDYAHVVLPSVSFVEKEGTATNCERRIQRLDKVLETDGNARSDFELMNGLLEQLDPSLKVDSEVGAFAEAAQLIKELGNLAMDNIGTAGVQWPVNPEGAGTECLTLPEDEKGKFKFYAARL